MADSNPYDPRYQEADPTFYESLDNLAAAKASAQKRADKDGKDVRVFAREATKVDDTHTAKEYRPGLDRTDVRNDARQDGWAPTDFVATPKA